MKRLYFVRHGLSEFNKSNTWAGSSDTPLAAEGHDQAKEAGRKAREAGLVFDVIVSSPLQRAIDTARHVANELEYSHDKIITSDLLIERNFGSLEGNKDLVAATRYIEDESSIDNLEGVESLADLQKRAEEAFRFLNSLPHDTILVVGHGASGRALRRLINKESLDNRGKIYANAELVRLI